MLDARCGCLTSVQYRATGIGYLAGRQGFEPWVELLAPQPLSRRPQSSTLAPPRDCRDGVFPLHTIALHYTPSSPRAQILDAPPPPLLPALVCPHCPQPSSAPLARNPRLPPSLAALVCPTCSQPSSRGRVMSSTLAHRSTSALYCPHRSQPSSAPIARSPPLPPIARSPRLEGVLCQAPLRIGAPPRCTAPIASSPRLPPLLAALVSRACYVKHTRA
jgi:hypothetical protein